MFVLIRRVKQESDFMPFKRNWLQFSLRTLLAVMLGASLLMAWVAHKRNEAAEQRRAYQLILDKNGASNFGPESARPPWLQWILGEDVAGTGGCIEFYGPDLNDADLATLTSLRQIRRLSLDRTQVTDRGLVHLQKLPHLRYLSLDETKVTDDGLESLHACHSLEFVSLYGTRTTSAGVERLQTALPDLHVIDKDEMDLPPRKKANDQ
jgi:hypothetical protein